MPFAAAMPQGPMVLAFTTAQRAHDAGLSMGLSPDEASRLLATPLPGAIEWAATLQGAGIVALGAAVSYLEGIGMAAVEEREKLLAIALTDALASLPFIDIVGPVDGARHVGAVSFNVRGVHPHDVSSILDMNEVCIRAGHHCAEPLLKRLGESSTCRASIALYNDLSDIDRLVNGLESVWKVFNG
jgi:cysteine desulfurase/selenocysteine lyase